MQEIDIQEIIDYSKCPMLYFFKHKYKLTTEYIDVTEKYEKDLLKVIYYSYSKLQDNDFIRIEDIKQMWGRLWVKDRRRIDLVFSDSYIHKDFYNIKRIKGLESLLLFRDSLAEDNCFPIAVNQPYKIKIGDIIINGKFDVVREIINDNGEKEIQSCIFKTDTYATRLTQRYDMKFNCDAIAIEQMTKEKANISNMIYYIEKGKSITKKSNSLSKGTFIHNVRTITNLISNNVFYMSVNENCDSCIYKNICSNKCNISLLLDKEKKE